MNSNRVLNALSLSIAFFFILAAASAAFASPLPSALDATFTVFFSDGTSVVATSNDVIGLQPNQAVTVVAQYPLSWVGHRITAIPLDGGRVLGSTSQFALNADPAVQFQFQAGTESGVYQVSLRSGAQEIGIHFWVFDSETPSNNPVVINQ